MSQERTLAILLSGRGSNFLAIHDAITRGDLDADIVCVVSDKKDAPGLLRAREIGLEAVCVPPHGESRKQYDENLLRALQPHAPRLICLAGFMRILTAEFLHAYQGRILNIHPSLLPAFPGLHAQKQALEHGVKISGCTVHLVDAGIDTGPIILQSAVRVLDDDTEETLSARILKEEHQTYWRAVSLILKGEFRLEGRRVRVPPRSWAR